MNEPQTVFNPFFERPVLNSPYAIPTRHWELDANGQPTQQIIERRRRAEFITPIPKPKKHKNAAKQDEFVFDEGKGLSTKEQQYDPTSIINEVRGRVDTWRLLPPNSSSFHCYLRRGLLPRRDRSCCRRKGNRVIKNGTPHGLL